MALPNRRSFSKESSDIHLTGRLCCGEDWGMYGNYPNDSKLRGKYPKLDALEYLDNYAALPADRPVGYPHLINMDKYQEHIQRQGLRIADAVVTVLYNWEPEALTAFLDDDLEDFRFQVVDFSDHPQNFYVQRKRRRVEAGYIQYRCQATQLTLCNSAAGLAMTPTCIGSKIPANGPQILSASV